MRESAATRRFESCGSGVTDESLSGAQFGGIDAMREHAIAVTVRRPSLLLKHKANALVDQSNLIPIARKVKARPVLLEGLGHHRA